MSVLPLSIQLYTLRDRTARDFAGTLKELARIGYKGVELAGYGNLSTAAEVRKAADDAGLVISSAHLPIEPLLTDPDKIAADFKVLGTPLVVCPWAALDGKDEAAYTDFAAKLEQVGKALSQRGLTFAYHNHSFELKPFRKSLDGLDILFGKTSPKYVKAELDLFWIQHGGHDPARYLKRMGDRCILVHLKDMEVGPDRRFANVGEGIVDFPAIIAAAKAVGVRWYVVEQDDCYGQDPLDAARISFANLRRLGYV